MDRYVHLTDPALKQASILWAKARVAGQPTAEKQELDCDVLIAAQALEYECTFGPITGGVIVATTNVAHLSRSVSADIWSDIGT